MRGWAAAAGRGWAAAAALVIACRGDHSTAERGGRAAPAAVAPQSKVAAAAPSAPASLVPVLPASPDGTEELRALDRRIELHRGEPELEILLLLQRAWVRGRLDDYLDALERSRTWVTRAPDQRRAWQARAQVLTRVHEFAAARAALVRLRRLTPDPDAIEGLAATIDEATGVAGAAAYREKMARDYPDPTTLTQWATTLATAGRHREALAVMQRVPALIHDNPPQLLAWILFQWGRIYERNGEPAAARPFYEAAQARLPTVDAAVHLAQTIAATGGDPRALVAAALADNRHPDLLALAGEIDEARLAWERHVAALPRAFADHAARFFLGPGRDPARAFALARLDLANRDTSDARTLAVEAAIAAGEATAACELAAPLARGTPAQQFMAWRAFTTCHRTDDAAALADRLGIR